MTAVTPTTEDRSFMGHPKALAFISFTEAWERFSYYGMTALLALYMSKQLLQPGHIEHVIGMDATRWFLNHTEAGKAIVGARQVMKDAGEKQPIWFYLVPAGI